MTRVMSLLTLAGLALAGTAGSSQASLIVTVNGVPQPVSMFPPSSAPPESGSGVFTFMGATGQFAVSSNQVGTSAATLQTSVTIFNDSGATVSGLVITITENNYTLTPGQFDARFVASASVIGPTSQANGVTLSTAIDTPLPPDFSATFATVTPGNSPRTSNQTGITPIATRPSSITATFTVGSIVNDTQLNLDVLTGVTAVGAPPTAVIPVPATALAAVFGLPVLGLFGRLRRRGQTVVA